MTGKPPPNVPVVITKEKEAYQCWIPIHRDFPRTERFGLGIRIENAFLDMLELSFAAVYLPLEPKILALGKTISKLDTLKFFMQLAWESRLIPTLKYTMLSEKLEEIGRMLGGWRKGLLEKLPPQQGGRK